MTTKLLPIVEQLVIFSPRQLEGETKTLAYLETELKQTNIVYRRQEFTIELPKYTHKLLVDGKEIGGMPCALESGEITDKQALHNTLLDPNYCDEPNINFSPVCSGHSLATFYHAPAIAVNHAELETLLAGKDVHGSVTVERVSHATANILVGNLTNPRKIVFAHIDSIQMGAVDNASGVAVTLNLLKEQPEILNDNLIIFSACEELSFAKPYYWGYGYRVFEKEYEQLMKDAKEILVIDSVGQTDAQIYDKSKLELMRLAFPIEHMDEWQDRIKVIAGDLDVLMTVYHSDLDDLTQVHEDYLRQAQDFLAKHIQA
jgi:hypothetical protein